MGHPFLWGVGEKRKGLEVLLEAALVICSITLLTRKRIFWGIGLVLGICGLAVGAAGLFIH